MKNKFFFLILASMSALAAQAQTISFSSMTSSVSGEYDFYSEVPLQATARISISNMKNNTTYPYYVTVEPAIGARYLSKSGSGYYLPYTAYSMPSAPRSELYDFSNASSQSQVIAGLFSKDTSGGSTSATAYHDFYIVATPGTLVPAGTYTGNASVRLYRKAFKTNTTPINKSLHISLTVPIYTELSVVPSGGIFDTGAKSANMDFKEMTAGSSLSLDVLAKSNASYSIAISSTKGGRLARNPDTGQSVPYTLKFAGATLVLQQGVSVPAISYAPWTSGNIARYTLQVIIGAHDVLDQGYYSDNLTFTISGN